MTMTVEMMLNKIAEYKGNYTQEDLASLESELRTINESASSISEKEDGEYFIRCIMHEMRH